MQIKRYNDDAKTAMDKEEIMPNTELLKASIYKLKYINCLLVIV